MTIYYEVRGYRGYRGSYSASGWREALKRIHFELKCHDVRLEGVWHYCRIQPRLLDYPGGHP
mgnify:CR=1 FL=1